MREKVRQLEDKVEALSGQQSTQLEETIEQYLDDSSAWQAAAAGQGVEGLTFSANFTANVMGTVGLDPTNTHRVSGDVDLIFDMKVTENLDLHISLTANTGDVVNNLDPAVGGAFEDLPILEANGGRNIFSAPPLLLPTAGYPTGFPLGSVTLSGIADGIGVDGTQPTSPGNVTVYEAVLTHRMPVGKSTLHTEVGSMDPRTRFLGNAYADDENTQFLNNLFDDQPSMLWLTDASGRVVLGLHMWIAFGDKEQYILNWGWFNTAGDFFNNGQFMIQFTWKGEVGGKAMNLRLMGFIDNYWVDGADDGSTGGGFTWDWAATEKIGVWFQLATSSGDVNPVELDAAVGVQVHNFIESRPDDVLGFAWGLMQANTPAVLSGPEDEMVIELYYRFVGEDGKLQVTPYFQYIIDPGGGTFANGGEFSDDSLVLLGIRFYVPF